MNNRSDADLFLESLAERDQDVVRLEAELAAAVSRVETYRAELTASREREAELISWVKALRTLCFQYGVVYPSALPNSGTTYDALHAELEGDHD